MAQKKKNGSPKWSLGKWKKHGNQGPRKPPRNPIASNFAPQPIWVVGKKNPMPSQERAPSDPSPSRGPSASKPCLEGWYTSQAPDLFSPREKPSAKTEAQLFSYLVPPVLLNFKGDPPQRKGRLVPCPFCPGILLCRKPPETRRKRQEADD